MIKNKVAPPFRQAEFDIMYNEGISAAGSVLDTATDIGVVRKSGAWFYYGDDRLGQGRENAKIFLKANPEMMDEIATKVMRSSPELAARLEFAPDAEDRAEADVPVADENGVILG